MVAYDIFFYKKRPVPVRKPALKLSFDADYLWIVSVRVVTPAAVSTLTMYTPMV